MTNIDPTPATKCYRFCDLENNTWVRTIHIPTGQPCTALDVLREAWTEEELKKTIEIAHLVLMREQMSFLVRASRARAKQDKRSCMMRR